MLHSTDMDENLDEVVEAEECKVLRMNDPGGAFASKKPFISGMTIFLL